MMNAMLKRLFLVGLSIMLSFSLMAQTDASANKKQKRAEKKHEALKQKSAKAAQKGKERHRDIQTKETRKRMKRHSKRGIHVDSYDRRPNFIKRIFRKKKAKQFGEVIELRTFYVVQMQSA